MIGRMKRNGQLTGKGNLGCDSPMAFLRPERGFEKAALSPDSRSCTSVL